MNDQTQTNENQLNKSQQPEQGASKQDQSDQTLNQAKTGQEEKTFQGDEEATQAQAGQYAKGEQDQETEIEDEGEEEEEVGQADTSNS